MSCRKRCRFTRRVAEQDRLDEPPFERLPDDLVICVLSKLGQSSSRPSDFISSLIVCKRFNQLCKNHSVLSLASPKLFSIKPKNWSESTHRFLKQCVDAGSLEASYFLGMIRFYCLKNRSSGASLMAKAAMRSHAPSLYALALIQFNGSGGTKSDKDLRAGAALCARAAFLGHVDALRELGHCLQDGYGVRRNITEGRRLLIQANAIELASALPSVTALSSWGRTVSPLCKVLWQRRGRSSSIHKSGSSKRRRGGELCGMEDVCYRLDDVGGGCALLSDFGYDVPAQELHPVNRFLLEWFDGLESGLLEPGLRMCSNPSCGRPEIRAHEFRRCSVCGTVNYCSRGCQAHDWKLKHKWQCRPVEDWVVVNGGQQGVIIGDDGGAGGDPAVHDQVMLET